MTNTPPPPPSMPQTNPLFNQVYTLFLLLFTYLFGLLKKADDTMDGENFLANTICAGRAAT